MVHLIEDQIFNEFQLSVLVLFSGRLIVSIPSEKHSEGLIYDENTFTIHFDALGALKRSLERIQTDISKPVF